jgi:hypothetical protein
MSIRKRKWSSLFQGTLSFRRAGMERAMALRYVITFPVIFLLLYGTLPVAVSAMYGGNPPAHIASLLDKQMDTFGAVARMIFGPITSISPLPP